MIERVFVDRIQHKRAERAVIPCAFLGLDCFEQSFFFYAFANALQRLILQIADNWQIRRELTDLLHDLRVSSPFSERNSPAAENPAVDRVSQGGCSQGLLSDHRT